MRLGDLDALKKVIHSSSLSGNREWLLMDLDQIIDNAPTVEYTFEEAFQKTVCEQRLYCPQRPQGEWKKERKYYSDVLKNIYFDCSCSCCGARFPFAQIPETIEDAFYSFNYCPSCGAEMQKGGAE